MNKNTLIVVAVALVLLLGGGAYLMLNRNAPSGESSLNTSDSVTVGTETSGPKSLKDLILGGVAQKCTYTDTTSGTEGVSYIANGKVRADYTTSEGTTTTNGHMIADGTTSYVWMDGQDTGFKMSFDLNEEAATDVPEVPEGQDNQALDVNEAMDYKCSPWLVDGSMFSPPSNVTFTDFSSMLPTAGTGTAPDAGTGQGIPNACAACDSLNGEAKTSCLQALNCN